MVIIEDGVIIEDEIASDIRYSKLKCKKYLIEFFKCKYYKKENCDYLHEKIFKKCNFSEGIVVLI